MYCCEAANSRATCSVMALGKRGLGMAVTLPGPSGVLRTRQEIRRVRFRAGLRRDSGKLAAELLDAALGGVELRNAEPVERLAALPERDCLLEPCVAALELRHDPFELPAGLLEGRLRPVWLQAHGRIDLAPVSRPRPAAPGDLFTLLTATSVVPAAMALLWFSSVGVKGMVGTRSRRDGCR